MGWSLFFLILERSPQCTWIFCSSLTAQAPFEASLAGVLQGSWSEQVGAVVTCSLVHFKQPQCSRQLKRSRPVRVVQKQIGKLSKDSVPSPCVWFSIQSGMQTSFSQASTQQISSSPHQSCIDNRTTVLAVARRTAIPWSKSTPERQEG